MENIKSWNPLWDKVFSGQEWGRYPSDNLIQFVARNFYKKERQRVKILEVGCGTGANMWYIAREGFKAFGIDGSQVAVQIARERLQKDRLKAELIVGDIINLPYADNQFDAVVDNECIYANNTDNSKKIIAEIYRVLKPGGLFYSKTFSDKMYLGKHNIRHSEMEYSEISDGPLAGMGFSRLSSKETIKDVYSKFKFISLDCLEYSSHNRSFVVSEWVVIGQKTDEDK